MGHKDQSELTDQELIEKQNKINSNLLINAILIGFLIGIVIYSIVINNIGFFTLIPLFFAYKLSKKT